MDRFTQYAVAAAKMAVADAKLEIQRKWTSNWCMDWFWYWWYGNIRRTI